MTIKELQKFVRYSLSNIYADGELKSVSDILLEHHTGRNYIYISLHTEEQVSEQVCNAVAKHVSMLQQHCPIQYLTGKACFYDMQLYVNEHVLIPRHETEELVQWILQDYGSRPARIWDMCTGSGCIAIALAKNMPQAQVYACDISKQALQVAGRNATEQQVNIQYMLMDVLQASCSCATMPLMDIIVSNPPYVCNKEKAYMQPRVLNYEPALALYVDDDHPLVFYKAIAHTGTRCLRPGGSLYVEINEHYGPHTVQLLRECGYSQVELKQDINRKDRMIKAIL